MKFHFSQVSQIHKSVTTGLKCQILKIHVLVSCGLNILDAMIETTSNIIAESLSSRKVTGVFLHHAHHHAHGHRVHRG